MAYVLLVAAFAPMTALSADAREKENPGSGFSIDVDQPYEAVLAAVRQIAGNGIILGTSESTKDKDLAGAVLQPSSKLFAAWDGPGQVFYKIRNKALAPVHFVNSSDMGTVAVRYVVQPLGTSSTRLFIDAIFVEDSRRRGHP